MYIAIKSIISGLYTFNIEWALGMMQTSACLRTKEDILSAQCAMRLKKYPVIMHQITMPNSFRYIIGSFDFSTSKLSPESLLNKLTNWICWSKNDKSLKETILVNWLLFLRSPYTHGKTSCWISALHWKITLWRIVSKEHCCCFVLTCICHKITFADHLVNITWFFAGSANPISMRCL